MDLLPPPPTQSPYVLRTNTPSTAKERKEVLRQVEYNVFAFPASMVVCDFLSDSGTSAMTDVQWAAMIRGDEAYGRNSGYYCLLDAFRDIFERGDAQERIFRDVVAGTADSNFYLDNFLKPHEGGFVNGGHVQLARPNFFIVPQGRCAETLLFSTMREMLPPASPGEEPVIISNGFFDTTGANAAVAGFELQTFTQVGLHESFEISLLDEKNPFKGNLDLKRTADFLNDQPGRVAMLLVTITNNFAGAQPVSMANIAAASALAKKHGVPIFFDACRFAENARFIQEFEKDYAGHSINEIVREMFSHVDGFTISLKKDGLANMGGALAIRDGGLFMQKFSGEQNQTASIGVRLKERQILCYGNDSYGGMSGRDLMAATIGLYEVTKQSFLINRIGQVRSFAKKLHNAGVPLLLPPGGHAIYLDMDEFFEGCGRRPDDFASVGFTLELLWKYGVRAAEAGPFAWEWDKKDIKERNDIIDLVRFAVPRNAMTDAHIDYAVAAISQLHKAREKIPSVVISRGKELRIRHFHCGFTPIPVSAKPERTFYNAAQTQLSRLAKALSLDIESRLQLLDDLKLSMFGWADKIVPGRPTGRLSNVGLDHSPVEYSVAIEHETGKSQLRFLIEAQPVGADASPESFHEEAKNLTNRAFISYPNDVSLERLKKIQELFTPSSEADRDSFSAWHSACASPSGRKPQWKIYLNPLVNGPDHSRPIVFEAMNRLGLTSQFQTLENMMSDQDSFVYFALDLDGGPASRVKVYVKHPNATPKVVSSRLAALCPKTDREEVEAFLQAMSGGSNGPFIAKPVLTCFAFTEGKTDPEGTVHFPVSEYARDDAEIKQRVGAYYKNKSQSVLEGYQKCISKLSSRSLDEGRGLHSWISLKRTNKRGLVTTFYLSSELYGVLASTGTS